MKKIKFIELTERILGQSLPCLEQMKTTSQEVYDNAYDNASRTGTMGVGGRGNEADNADLNGMTWTMLLIFFMALHLR